LSLTSRVLHLHIFVHASFHARLACLSSSSLRIQAIRILAPKIRISGIKASTFSIGTSVWSMLRVQTFVAIANLFLVLSKSICRAIHCKYHSWSTGTTWLLFFTLVSSFTITRRAIQGFTTSIHEFTTFVHESTRSIGLQHFQQICMVSMLPTEVPQPLQQPMLLYKPLESFVALYT